MKNLKVNWEKLSQKLANHEKLYNEASDSYKDKIEYLMISYIDGSEYYSMIEKLTVDPDKIDFILIELTDYSNNLSDNNEYYKKNIFRILND